MPKRKRPSTRAVLRQSKILHDLYDVLRLEKRRQWDRDLPFEELLFDRIERARSLNFGSGSTIYHNSYVYGDVTVGAHTWIGPFTVLDGSGGLTVGDYCNISTGVLIYSHDTVERVLSRGKAPLVRGPVQIGDCCYIGSHAVIAKDVRIGDHVVVGACSFVNRDVAPFSIVAGAPCRRIGRVRLDRNGMPKLIFNRRR
jgi:acetyltransferase-like isoleucine patch superfamily enzyme